jgi:LPS export ABC transporter protein LptC
MRIPFSRNMRVVVALVAVSAAAAACSEPGGPPVTESNPMADSAEQIMYGVRATLRSMGVNRGSLRADSAFFFEEGTRMELFGVQTTFFNQLGASSGELTSRRGTYNTRNGEMEAREDVVVTNTDGRRLTTPHLRYQEGTNQVMSDSAFVVTSPDGERLEGIGFTSDPNLEVIRVHRASSGTAGAVQVPDR